MTAGEGGRGPTVPPGVLREVVELACRAPSVHNTQPWSWRAVGTTLELYADPRRRMPAADPQGRNLVISCGAALHHAHVAAGALGWEAKATRLPSGDRSPLLARISFTHATPPRDATAHVQAIRDRRTDRRRFTSWPVPEHQLRGLADAASAWGADAVPVLDPSRRHLAEVLVGRALELHATDERLGREQLEWVDHGEHDGVPGGAVPTARAPETRLRTRYGTGALEETERTVVANDRLMVLRGAHDTVEAWLRSGEGLSALWLQAAREGLTVVPLSQAVELDETREQLRTEVLQGVGSPHLVLRVGWQAIGRDALPPTPRRPLDDVLVG